jgi:hypothetical protein
MWANTTAGGYNSLNITTLNATTIRQGGNRVLDISGGMTWANISSGWSLNQLWTGTLGGANITSATITATQLANGAVGNAQIAAGAVNNTQITNAAINNTQLRNYVINNTQINLASINQSQLTQGFAINLGNITDPSDCTAAQKVIGKTTNVWDCSTDLFNTTTEIDTAINATANRYFQIKSNESDYLDNQHGAYYLNIGGFNAGNLTSGTISNIAIASNTWINTTANASLTGAIITKIYSSVICPNITYCAANMTYNGTNWIIYG